MITLSLTGSAYARAIGYLKSISSQGAVVQGQELYRINKSGGWVAKANPDRQTITLEDSVGQEVITGLSNAAKPRRTL